MAQSTQDMTDGAAAAAIVSAGIGSLALGLLVVGAEVSAALKSALAVNAGVGPLSGKTIGACIAYFASWAVLHFMWRDKDVNFGRSATVTAVLVGLGILLTFPPVFQFFAPSP